MYVARARPVSRGDTRIPEREARRIYNIAVKWITKKIKARRIPSFADPKLKNRLHVFSEKLYKGK